LLINGIIVFCIFGVVTLYAILFTTIGMALFGKVSEPGSWLNSKIFYCVVLGTLQVPHVFRKNMSEMRISSYMLFTGIISLLVLMVVKLQLQGPYVERFGPEHTERYISVETKIDTLNICVTSFGFVLTLFPVYSSMRKDQRPKFKGSLYLALGIVFTLYIALTASAISYFGGDHIRPSLFENFSMQTDIESKIILAIFLLVLLTNIPFAFFAGKTALIAMCTILVALKQDEDNDDNFVAYESNVY